MQLIIRHYNIIFVTLFQAYYFQTRWRSMRIRKRHGVDPIKIAFEHMKVRTWQSIIFCFSNVYYSSRKNCKTYSCSAEGEETTNTIEELF